MNLKVVNSIQIKLSEKEKLIKFYHEKLCLLENKKEIVNNTFLNFNNMNNRLDENILNNLNLNNLNNFNQVTFNNHKVKETTTAAADDSDKMNISQLKNELEIMKAKELEYLKIIETYDSKYLNLVLKENELLSRSSNKNIEENENPDNSDDCLTIYFPDKHVDKTDYAKHNIPLLNISNIPSYRTDSEAEEAHDGEEESLSLNIKSTQHKRVK
jgi:hypothetical protein